MRGYEGGGDVELQLEAGTGLSFLWQGIAQAHTGVSVA